jgi:hypothetical protein
LDQHVELFAKTGPPIPFAEHRIDTGDSTPIASPPYGLTPGKRQILQTEIDAMLEAGIVEECESAWTSPAVLVPKPDGSTRVCVDYRRLNAVTKPDMYPLSRMDELYQYSRSLSWVLADSNTTRRSRQDSAGLPFWIVPIPTYAFRITERTRLISTVDRPIQDRTTRRDPTGLLR